nr:FG-GAP-like repeat-containing protein [Micromonospora sp. NBC_00855]
MSPSKTALHPRSAHGGRTRTVAAILAAVLVSVGLVATPAGAADAYTQVYEFSYPANEEPLIEEGLNENYDAQYYDSDQGFLIEHNDDLFKRGVLCEGDIKQLSAEELGECLVRKVYDVPTSNDAPDDFRIELRPGENRVAVTIHDDKPPSANGETWAHFGFTAGITVATLLIRSACLSGALNRQVDAGNTVMKGLCVGIAEFLSNFLLKAVQSHYDGTLGDGHTWGANTLAAAVAGKFAFLWEHPLQGAIVRDGGTFWTNVANVLNAVWAGLSRACVVCGGVFGAAYQGLSAAISTTFRAILPRGETALRVMPLGDSITYGVGVSDPEGTGYRARLWSGLSDAPVLDFVGSMNSGTLPDRNHEGHPWWRIADIDRQVDCVIPRYRPNVVLLHIGTNDMQFNDAVDDAPARLEGLIGKIVRLAPETTVLVAKLVPAFNTGANNNVQRYNAAIPGVVDRFRAAGKRVRLVDMGAVTRADLTDTVHPNAEGYRKMADAFLGAVRSARAENLIEDPVGASPVACGGEVSKVPDSVSGDTSAQGEGWRWQGVVASGVGANRDRVQFADVDGDGLDDYLVLDDQARVKAWTNAHTLGGGFGWRGRDTIATGVGAVPENVRFADVDGDGLDDYLVVDGTGRVSAWINQFTPGTGFGWDYAGVIATGVGATRDQIRFADFTGDGLDDYLVVDGSGRITAYSNEFHPGGAYGWSSLGLVAAGVGAARDRVRFADLNGDARDDYLVVHDEGHVKVWLNTVPRFVVQAPGHPTPRIEWQNHGQTLTATAANRDQVRFADLNGDGKDDYLLVDSTGKAVGALNDRYGQPDTWDWQGVVGQNPNADTTSGMVDLTGDGRADWVAIRADGTVAAWTNRLTQGGGYGWDYAGQITAGVTPGRERVRFADVDGDGKDDYLVIDDVGGVKAWINNYAPDRGFVWDYAGVIAAGVGAAKERVRFADMNGDRKDDYVVVDDAGEVRAWLNKRSTSGYGWDYVGQISPGVGAARDQVHLTDLNGDLRADYLVVDAAGRVYVWINAYKESRFGWRFDGLVASGVGVSGGRVRFADLNGDRRADYLIEDPGGQIRAWTFNGYYVIQKAPDEPMSGTPTTSDVDIDLDPCVLVLNLNRGPCDT